MLNLQNILKITLQEKAHTSSVDSQGLLSKMKRRLRDENPALSYVGYLSFSISESNSFNTLVRGAFILAGCISHRELLHLHHLCHCSKFLVLVPEHGAQSSVYSPS